MRVLLLLTGLFVAESLFATVFHLNPESGMLTNDGSAANPWPSLEEVINAGYIQSFKYGNLPYNGSNVLVETNTSGLVRPGDTLLLHGGLHGDVILHQYNNPDFITIMAAKETTPVIRKVHLRAATRWRFVGVTVSSEPYGEYVQDPCFWLNSHGWQGPVSRIEIIGCHLYSTLDNASWSAADWRARVRRGIGNDGGHNLIQDNLLENLSMGITFNGDSVRVLNNEVRYFAGDGLRILGSHALVEGNTIHGCVKIDDNHDDGIQSFNIGTYRVDSNIVRGNTIRNYVDPAAPHPLSGTLQGIGAFDGPFTGWTVENNVISVDHWHGITFLGAFDMKLVNNTVIDPSPDVTPGPSWIRIDPHKDGTPSERNLIANNVSNRVAGTGFDATHNATFTTFFDYSNHFQDYANYDFRLRENSALIDTGLDSLAAAFDFFGTIRPRGLASDPGAYEYEPTTAISFTQEQILPTVFPNPTNGDVWLAFPTILSEKADMTLFDSRGRQVRILGAAAGAKQVRVNLVDQPSGIYFLRGKNWSVKLVKQ